MERGWGWRVLGGVAVLWLLAGAGVVWVLFGARLGAVSGIAGPTGTFVVSGCFEGLDSEDTHCRGTYVPTSASAPARHVLLRSAADDHQPGTRLDVRLVGGDVFEPSPLTAAEYVVFAGWTAATFGLPGHWMFASARRGRFRDGEGYFFVWLASLVGAVALGLLALPVAWLLVTIRG
ncbi:hypothetical protein [Streptomyces sp. NPDC058486]|uniref:hypothetical protein n=1 Tax=unclassified Streptomyces TaxID=2593676 RepID=UPI0036497B7A